MRGAIFDLDGTLADTSADLLAAANVTLREQGLPQLDAVADRQIAGRGGKSMLRRSLEIAGRPIDGEAEIKLVDALYQPFLKVYADALAVRTTLFPGVIDCLDQLAETGWLLGVCTNKLEGLAVQLLDKLNVRARFSAILGADTLAVRKPHPDHVIETARRIGAEPRRCVMVGDTTTDLSAAEAAEIPCVLTRFGFAAEPVDTLGASAVIDSFEALPPILERLSPQKSPA
ncbi:MAG: HAD-IA family hydrolase [Pseudomonadota bacterium]